MWRRTKMKKRTLFILLIMVLLISTLTACGNPIDSLNSDESEVFEALIIALDTFTNPKSVRVMDISDIRTRENLAVGPTDIRMVTIKLLGENSFGATIQNTYSLYFENGVVYGGTGLGGIESVYNGSLVESSINVYSSDKIDVAKLNKALDYHWEELGIK